MLFAKRNFSPLRRISKVPFCVSLEYAVYYAAHSQARRAAGKGRKAWWLSPFNPKLKVKHVLLARSIAILTNGASRTDDRQRSGRV
jgi:hypothetical protein